MGDRRQAWLLFPRSADGAQLSPLRPVMQVLVRRRGHNREPTCTESLHKNGRFRFVP